MAVKITGFELHMGAHQRMAWRRPFLMLCCMQLPPRTSSHQILMLDQSIPCLQDIQIIQTGTPEASQWMLSGSVIQVLLVLQVMGLDMMMVML
jgi:hypothetical protein